MKTYECSHVGKGNVRVIYRERIMEVELDFYLLITTDVYGHSEYVEYGVVFNPHNDMWAIYTPKVIKEIQEVVYESAIFVPSELMRAILFT